MKPRADMPLDFPVGQNHISAVAVTLDQVASEALGLPAPSRALLVEKLLASLGGEIDASSERVHLDDIRHRRAAVKEGKSVLIEGDEALRHARAAFGK